MDIETAKLFQNGSSQAVRLPKAYRFQGNEVIIKRFGDAVILIPKQYKRNELARLLESLDGDASLQRSQPKEQQVRSFSQGD